MIGEIVSQTKDKLRFPPYVILNNGVIKKVVAIDAFVIPEDADNKMVTLDFYYGVRAFEENNETVYEGFVVREKFKFPILESAEDIKFAAQEYWNTNYKPLDDAIDGLEALKNIVI